MSLIVSFLGLFSLLYSTVGVNVSMDFGNNTVNNNSTIYPEGITEGVSAIASCTCDGKTLQEDFQMDSMKTDVKDIDVFKDCEKNTTALCEFSKTCDNCTLEIKNCSRLSENENTTNGCFSKNIKVYRGPGVIKTKIIDPYRHRRDLFLTGDCIFPSELQTAELKCLIHPKFIKCRQNCIFGYTLEEGISREMVCYHKDKKWSGRGFKECLPFVDCTLTLVTGGNMNCVKNTMQTPPHCDVSCTAYEDKPAVPTAKYTCTTELHKWNPNLPHCVLPGSGFDLVPAPRIKDHSKEDFELDIKHKKSHSRKVAKPTIAHPDKNLEDMNLEDKNLEDKNLEDAKKDDTKKVDTKEDDAKEGDTKKDDTKKDDTKKDDTTKDDTTKDDTKKDDTKANWMDEFI